MAGYVATADSWLDIESKWVAVLACFGVPYLHMREYAHSEIGSPFESWKGDESKRSEFIAALTDVINDSDLFGVGAVLRIPDLRKFNHSYRTSLQGYPLCVYACLIELSRKHQYVTIEAALDRCASRHETLIAMAREYAETDRNYPECGRGVQITPLRGFVDGTEVERSSKNVPALQIGDFAAYELLISHREKNDWFKNEEPFIMPEEWLNSQFSCNLKKVREGKVRTLHWPNERKSYMGICRS
jgi:hypothetical protein